MCINFVLGQFGAVGGNMAEMILSYPEADSSSSGHAFSFLKARKCFSWHWMHYLCLCKVKVITYLEETLAKGMH